jgi:hypothetical protein
MLIMELPKCIKEMKSKLEKDIPHGDFGTM